LDLRVDHTITPNPNSPLGAKGAGEAGTVGAVAAVLNAVHDALAPLGIEVPDMPLTPSKIWEALHGRSREVQP
jgi:carbon-monoxide dehydrogenase large subunit